MAKGNKGAAGVKFNTMTTDERITVAVRVRRDAELLAECITALINSSREGGIQTTSILLLHRGYSYEPIIGAVLKARRGDASKPVDISATVSNYILVTLIRKGHKGLVPHQPFRIQAMMTITLDPISLFVWSVHNVPLTQPQISAEGQIMQQFSERNVFLIVGLL